MSKLTEREKWLIAQCEISWAPMGCSIDEAYLAESAPLDTRDARIAELEAIVREIDHEHKRFYGGEIDAHAFAWIVFRTILKSADLVSLRKEAL